jgi:glycosyltransferase involved in cell wall biosynthesis
MKILHSLGIHKDGGYRIYKNFQSLKYDKIYIDPRIKKKSYKIFIILHRIYVDLHLFFKIKDDNTSITYLSGTCPAIKSKAFSIACFQNGNIFFKKNTNLFYWLLSFDFLRYINFQLFKNNVDQWIVFTEVSRSLLINNGVKDYKIKIVNIFNIKNNLIKKKNNIKKKFDFIYPANFRYHKNHNNLIKAIILLNEEKIYPSVLLTLNKHELKNSKYLKIKKKYKLNISFKYYKNIEKAYLKSKALIYPSLNETLGFPLIEAYNNDLPVISSDLPYSYQFYKPNLVFNANEPKDIANKMKYFLLSKKIFSKPKFNFNEFITIKQFQKLL